MTTKESTQSEIPFGYVKDAKGRFVPESMYKPIDKARDALVIELTGLAKDVNKTLGDFKARVFADAISFIELSAEQYGAKLGGEKGNVTLTTFDGRLKMQVRNAENITFDERLQAAKALIDECIEEWSKTSSPEIKVLVQDAFQTDKEGKLRTGNILGLRRLNITDERWQRAMTAIGESIQVIGSKRYVTFHERIGDSDKYAPISLDIAGA